MLASSIHLIYIIMWVDNEAVVEAAPTGDAPTKYEWSTSLLSAKLR